jgi:hypothetical protein
LASFAPEAFAAFSIFALHMPQFPDTGIFSVVSFCANGAVASKDAKRRQENILSDFIIVRFRISDN